MLSVYRTLSVRYLSRRWFRAVLIVCSIALGVATLVATRALNETMTRAGLATVNPLAGVADLVVNNGEAPVPSELADRLRQVPGVQSANARIFRNVKLPDHDFRSVLVIGLDVLHEMGSQSQSKVIRDINISEETVLNYGKELSKFLLGFSKNMPVVVGKELDSTLPADNKLLKVGRDKKNVFELVRVGSLDAEGTAAVLGGHTLVLHLSHAAHVLGLKEGQANRIDVVVAPGTSLDKVREAVRAAVKGQAEVNTPDEQNQALSNVMSGMQTGFALCGLAALVVGLFLVYNVLAVCVAERRHEIGLLRALGATQRQVQQLFSGEAMLLGLAGSALGIPLGLVLANLGLDTVQTILSDIFYSIDARQVEITTELIATAMLAGTATAMLAALAPAIVASRENPAEAVRRMTKPPGWRHRVLHIVATIALLGGGVALIVFRHELPSRLGIYGGLVSVLLGALIATPLLTALGARCLLPLLRNRFPLEWRLAADNLIRAPGRTGLVIAALAAGVALVVQTAGTIRSNRIALRDWVRDYISSDLIASGSPVGSGGQTETMSPDLGRDLERLPDVEAALPLRILRVPYRDTHIAVNAVDAGRLFRIDQKRRLHAEDVALYRLLSERKNGIIVSENFTALHGKDKGDTITLKTAKGGEIVFTVLGKIADYSWNKGAVYVDRADYLAYWNDDNVDIYDVFLRPEAKLADVQSAIKKFGLHVLTRVELQERIDGMIERLYGIAYGQQVVVMFVAALGVVTALLISVLQRRREMGLLRAIGASRVQVVRSVLAEAALMGVFGTIIGVLVGIPLQWYVLKVLILEESGYLFPLYVPWTGALIIAAAAMITATLAGLGPALYAVRQRIPEAIAYE